MGTTYLNQNPSQSNNVYQSPAYTNGKPNYSPPAYLNQPAQNKTIGQKLWDIVTGQNLVDYEKSQGRVLVRNILPLPISTGAIMPSVGSLAAAAAKKVGQSFMKAPIPTTAAALIGVPFVAGVIAKKPSLVTSLPASSFNGGQNIVDAIEKHPTAAGIIGGVTGGALLYEGAKTLFGNKDTNISIPENSPLTNGNPINNSNPNASAGQNILNPPGAVKSSVKSNYRRGRAKLSPSISQKVNVIVSNDNRRATKTYLNKQMLYA